ncbi:murein L,D-transpeptidase catalytic domain family protein [uncultured Sphingomonas sp.]|uniref:murein L,D-transpeptidase catalytic domain family protein n=1 Tax=uncultured Sphingomonas sp. TaxID=158754 RepID=UPI0035CC894B
MHDDGDALHARRALLKNGLLLAGAVAAPGAIAAAAKRRPDRITSADLRPVTPPPPIVGKPRIVAVTSPHVVRPELMRRAMAALGRHGSRVKRDRMAIVDFSAKSAEHRFHFVELTNGRSTSLRVAHGSGSDPAHTGWLQRFSNDHGSNASCEGAFATADYYEGKHGLSQRLHGLDVSNNNALERAIVVHGAWYANPDMIRTHGMLGRSQGCFAFAEAELAQVFAKLGTGRMIYAAKI